MDSGITCGYESSLIFDTERGIDGAGPRYRRPLLTVKERELMSNEIVASVPPRLALWHITQIDEQCEDTLPVQGVSHGPFGAFTLASLDGTNAPESGSMEEFPMSEIPIQSAETESEPHPDSSWWLEAPEALGLMHCASDHPQYWSTPAEFDQPRETSLDFLSLTELVNMPSRSPSRWTDDAALPSPNAITDCLPISRCNSPISHFRNDIPQSAWNLVKNYTNSVLKSFTPYQHSKTPWHILFMPLVKNCLAGLTLNEDIDDATLCVFYGTLAMSALSLGGTSHSQSWTRKSDTYRRRAFHHMKAVKGTNIGGIKKTKYKSQLMAYITMAQLSTLSGNRSDTEYCLVEAEKLIRIHGLNRKKSRKVRLLHHCYAYERIFFESISTRGEHTVRYRDSLRKAIESSGASTYSKDSLSFRLPVSDNLESDMLTVKDVEMGENDLHLQNPGLWPRSQYEEIFGLPERYLLFVSLIVRLAREKDGEIDDDQPGTLTMRSFTKRAKAIERCINQSRPAEPRPHTAVDHLVAAMHSAVVIYFYRKIHDVDACMLQKQVSDVRNALQDFESSSTEKGFASVRLVWPACIAACEAEDAATQTFFANWFAGASQQIGLRLFDVTMANVERVWKQKREGMVDNIPYQRYVLEAGLEQIVDLDQVM